MSAHKFSPLSDKFMFPKYRAFLMWLQSTTPASKSRILSATLRDHSRRQSLSEKFERHSAVTPVLEVDEQTQFQPAICSELVSVSESCASLGAKTQTPIKRNTAGSDVQPVEAVFEDPEVVASPETRRLLNIYLQDQWERSWSSLSLQHTQNRMRFCAMVWHGLITNSTFVWYSYLRRGLVANSVTAVLILQKVSCFTIPLGTC